MSKLSKSLAVLLSSSAVASAVAAQMPVDMLKKQEPALYALYQGYTSYQATLGEYASRQGFRAPFENLATVVHEMVHIASAVHRGYFIDGTYYEPYLAREAGAPAPWPQLANKEVYPYILPDEKGVIYSVYMPSTPNNHLGNVIDEINAYAHVAGFVCVNEPDSAAKQIRNLVGHLHLQEAYLRVLRLSRTTDYLTLANDRESRGAMVSITTKAWDALRRCGITDNAIPSREMKYFLTLINSNKR
jgi:hypothetical protein